MDHRDTHRDPDGPGWRRWFVPLVAALVVVGLIGLGVHLGVERVRGLVTPTCRAAAAGRTAALDPEQTHNAAVIAAVAQRRGLPPRAVTIALATAIQESKLRNITYGDRDSVGLFQQRPSQGWGTREQILDPAYAANRFYDALVRIEGYEDMRITEIAQRVQRSAYPEAYADHEWEGRVYASNLTGHTGGGLGCRLKDPDGPGDASRLSAALSEELGVRGTATGRDVTVAAASRRQAWAVGTWAVAQAQARRTTSVTVGDRVWTRARGEEAWSWQQASVPLPEQQVRITVAG